MKLLLLLIIGIIIYIIIKKSCQKEKYESDIYILSDDEIKEFITKDKDGFINSLTQYDLKARNSNSKQEYINKIIESINNKLIFPSEKLFGLNLDQKKELLIKSIKEADKLLEKDYKDIKNMKWNIILMEGDIYENGYPHTRGKYIILNNRYIDLTITLQFTAGDFIELVNDQEYFDLFHISLIVYDLDEEELLLTSTQDVDFKKLGETLPRKINNIR
jgi:hypothetical protein